MDPIERLYHHYRAERERYIREYINARRRGLVIMRRHFLENGLRYAAKARDCQPQNHIVGDQS